jgi:predicted amidohydrolase YtcJ
VRVKPSGLREAHAHIAQQGREMSQLNVSSCASRAECLARIEAEAAGMDLKGEPGWLIANGVRVEAWAGAKGGPVWPTIRELDKVCPNRPCMVQSFDHHACAVNSAAMAAAGFTAGSADPEHGRIVRDSKGEVTGLLLEAAYGGARRAVPEPTREQWRRYVKVAADDLAGHGFVEVHDLLSQPWLGAVLSELDRAGELPVSVWLYPTVQDVEAVAAGAAAWNGPCVRLAGAKMFADGTLNSRTAWMLHPYADPIAGLPRGQAMVTHQQLHEAMVLTRRLGLGLAVHAIGDAAVRAVLDVYERAGALRAELGIPAVRIEHAEIIDEADVPRFAKLGVVCSVQPCHLLCDIEALKRGVPDRLDRVLPLRDLMRAGCRPGELLWFGSDTPIVRPHPEDSLQAAVQRRRAGMDAGAAIAPEQAIGEAEAWTAFGAR